MFDRCSGNLEGKQTYNQINNNNNNSNNNNNNNIYLIVTITTVFTQHYASFNVLQYLNIVVKKL